MPLPATRVHHLSRDHPGPAPRLQVRPPNSSPAATCEVPTGLPASTYTPVPGLRPTPPPHRKAPPDDLSAHGRAELRELLLAGARADGNPSVKAAVHLLLFTEMPQAPRFRQHVRIDHVRTLAYGLVHCAQVTDWRKLAD